MTRVLLLVPLLVALPVAAGAKRPCCTVTIAWPAVAPEPAPEARVSLLAAALRVRLARSPADLASPTQVFVRDRHIVVRAFPEPDRTGDSAEAIKGLAGELAFAGISPADFRRALDLISAGTPAPAPCSLPELQALATAYFGGGQRILVEHRHRAHRDD